MSDNNEIADALRDALTPRTTLVHHTYRHIARPMTIAGVNLAQWAVILVGLGATAAVTALLPMPSEWALSLAGSVVGVPAACLFMLFADGEIPVRSIVRSVIASRLASDVLLPAPGVQPAGYQLLDEELPAAEATTSDTPDYVLEDLWT